MSEIRNVVLADPDIRVLRDSGEIVYVSFGSDEWFARKSEIENFIETSGEFPFARNMLFGRVCQANDSESYRKLKSKVKPLATFYERDGKECMLSFNPSFMNIFIYDREEGLWFYKINPVKAT